VCLPRCIAVHDSCERACFCKCCSSNLILTHARNAASVLPSAWLRRTIQIPATLYIHFWVNPDSVYKMNGTSGRTLVQQR
jgi:hypothetical protein